MEKLVILEKEFIAGQAVAAAIAIAMTGASLEKIIQAALDVIPKDSWTYAFNKSSSQRLVMNQQMFGVR